MTITTYYRTFGPWTVRYDPFEPKKSRYVGYWDYPNTPPLPVAVFFAHSPDAVLTLIRHALTAAGLPTTDLGQ